MAKKKKQQRYRLQACESFAEFYGLWGTHDVRFDETFGIALDEVGLLRNFDTVLDDDLYRLIIG